MRFHASLRTRILLGVVGTPVCVLVVLAIFDALLALGGVRPRAFFRVERDSAGLEEFVATDAPPVPRARFRVERFRTRPPPGTKRIVCVGDSSCYGHPFDPPVPFSCWLATRLERLLPERRFEVLNLGCNTFGSENVRDLVEDVDGAGADLLVVYVGHNEFNDRNLNAVLHPFAHDVLRLFDRTALGNFFETHVDAKPGGRLVMEFVGSEAVHDEPFLDEARLGLGQRRYRSNLERIVAIVHAHGGQAVLVHPISDAVDTPVFESHFAPATPAEARRRFRDDLAGVTSERETLERAAAAGAAPDAARVRAALEVVDRLAGIDPGVATLRYERARLLLLAGRPDDARLEFAAAVDADGYPVRSTSVIQAILEDVARETHSITVDPAPLVTAEAGPALAGRNGWYVDYCHPDLRGHELVAEAILRKLAETGVLAPREEWRFADEPGVDEYRRIAGYDAGKQATTWARTALFFLGGTAFDPTKHVGLGAAEQLLDRALKHDPACAAAWLGRGILQVLRRRTDDALASFDRAIAIDPKEIAPLFSAYRENRNLQSAFAAAGLAIRDGKIVRTP